MVLCFVWGDYRLFISLELAALGGLTITLGSFRGYKKIIEAEAKKIHNFSDEEYEPYDAISGLNEPAKPQKKDWALIFKTFKGLISFFRILGYAVLAFSVFYLINKGLFSPIGFILGTLLVPFSALVSIKKLV